MKKIVALLLALVMVLGLAGCGGSTKEPETTLESATPTQEVTPEPTPEIITTEIVDGDTITIDGVCEFTVKGWDTAEKYEFVEGGMLHGLNTGSGEGTVAVWLNVDYKNLGTEEQRVNRLLDSSELLYDGTYKYDGGSNSFSDIVPLSTSEVIFYYRVPADIMEDDGSLVATFQIKDIPDQIFTYTIR